MNKLDINSKDVRTTYTFFFIHIKNKTYSKTKVHKKCNSI